MSQSDLTAEQKKEAVKYAERYKKVALKCGENITDKVKAEEAFNELYDYFITTKDSDNQVKTKTPQIIWKDNIIEAIHETAMLVTKKTPSELTKADLTDALNHGVFSQFEAYWIGTYTFINDHIDNKKDALIKIVNKVFNEVHAYWLLDEAVVAVPFPKVIKTKNDLIHADGEPAIIYQDGFSINAENGEIKPYVLETMMGIK